MIIADFPDFNAIMVRACTHALKINKRLNLRVEWKKRVPMV
jgi:hypothetical protein